MGEDIDSVPNKNTILICRNFWSYLQPEKQTSQMKALLSAKERAESMFPSLKDTDVYFRIFTNEESFPLTGSGKRNIRAIEELGLENTFKIANEKENEYEPISKKSNIYKK